MKSLQILTSWAGDGLSQATAHRPRIAIDFALLAWTDVTGQPSENLPTDVDLFVVEVVVTDAVFASIAASPYADGILSVRATGHAQDEAGIPASGEFARLRGWLVSRGVPPGLLVAAAAGQTVAGRTRRQIAQAVTAWLKARPMRP